MIQDTSLHAYKLATTLLGAKQKAVLGALRFFPDGTNAELARALNWPTNRVTPRTGAKTMGLILDVERRTCKATDSMGDESQAYIVAYSIDDDVAGQF